MIETVESWFGALWPRALRITGGRLAVSFPVLLIAELLVARTGENDGEEETDDASSEDVCQLDKERVIDICVQLFRMERNTARLAEQDDNKQTRALTRYLKRMTKKLAEIGVTFKAPTGEEYHPGRRDFKMIHAREEKGATTVTIGECDLPAVMLNGQLIQQAQGVVIKPPDTPTD